MRFFNEILIWENKRRVQKLLEFRSDVVEYFSNSKYEWMNRDRVENDKSQAARQKLNRALEYTHDVLICSGTGTRIRYTPPAAIGGYIQDLDLVENIFNLQNYQISPNNLLDIIDRAIGIYESDQSSAVIRVLNPFFYLEIFLDWISMVPFKLLAKLGFNQVKAQESFIGKIFKGLVYLITALASILTVLQLIDHLDPAKELIRKIIAVLVAYF